MRYRYTKFTGDALDELDLEDLVSKLSDLLLSSGFGHPRDRDETDRTMQALHDAILDALFNGGVLPEETIQRLLDLKPDLLVVVAYGNYLPAELVDAVPYKAVNVHPSLLPRYRGASPIQTAILNGDETTGVSTMTLAPEMDAGDIYLQESTPIDANETATELENRLSALGAELLLKTLDGLQQGSLRPKPQDAALVVMTRKFEKEDGRLDFTKSARALHNQIRACQPWPGAACTLKNKLFKIFATEVRTGLEGTEAGTVVESGETLVVVCGADALVLKEIQLEGKRRMSAAEFLTGTKVPVGTKLT